MSEREIHVLYTRTHTYMYIHVYGGGVGDGLTWSAVGTTRETQPACSMVSLLLDTSFSPSSSRPTNRARESTRCWREREREGERGRKREREEGEREREGGRERERERAREVKIRSPSLRSPQLTPESF